MKEIRSLFLLMLLVSPMTFGFTLEWDEPVVPVGDLAVIEVFQSGTPGVYDTNLPLARVNASNRFGGNVGTFTGPDPNSGTRYWVVRACDSSNNCSAFSNEVSKSFFDTTAPDAPGLRVK